MKIIQSDLKWWTLPSLEPSERKMPLMSRATKIIMGLFEGGYVNLNLSNHRFPREFSLERLRENGVYEEDMSSEIKRKSC